MAGCRWDRRSSQCRLVHLPGRCSYDSGWYWGMDPGKHLSRRCLHHLWRILAHPRRNARARIRSLRNLLYHRQRSRRTCTAAVLRFVLAVASLRTNVVLLGILTLLAPTFACLAASFFAASKGKADLSLTLQHAGGGLLFAVSMLG